MNNHTRFLNLIGVMAAVAAGFFLVIKIGFIVHHDPQPAPIDSTMLTAIAALVLFAATIATTRLAIRSGGRALTRARLRRRPQEAASAHARARQDRVARLAADPTRAQYAPLVARGEDWSDEQIAYDQDRSSAATCEHLQPIERAMRGAGIQVRLYKDRDVIAKCRVDFAALQRDFHLAPLVRYAEIIQSERGAQDIPIVFLICDEHKSIIHTMHPAEAGADQMPWFPTYRSEHK